MRSYLPSATLFLSDLENLLKLGKTSLTEISISNGRIGIFKKMKHHNNPQGKGFHMSQIYPMAFTFNFNAKETLTSSLDQ